MNLKICGFLFVLYVVSDATTGLTLNVTETVKNITKDLPAAPPNPEKPQTPSKDNGPVIVSNSPVTVIVPNASEILQKSSTTSAPDVQPTTLPPSTVPQTGKWIIRDNTTNSICIIAQMAMQLNVTYPGASGQIESAAFNLPSNKTTSEGNCESQTMKISWGPNHSIIINFGRNDTAKTFFISGMSLNVNASVFKNAAANLSTIQYVNNSAEFTTPLEMSYRCSKVQNISLESQDETKLKAVVSINDTQFEAFMNKTKAEFAAAQDCETFETPDIVPIAVGCALAILVLVVLVAYLIGRKRSQNKGYLSM